MAGSSSLLIALMSDAGERPILMSSSDGRGRFCKGTMRGACIANETSSLDDCMDTTGGARVSTETSIGCDVVSDTGGTEVLSATNDEETFCCWAMTYAATCARTTFGDRRLLRKALPHKGHRLFFPLLAEVSQKSKASRLNIIYNECHPRELDPT